MKNYVDLAMEYVPHFELCLKILKWENADVVVKFPGYSASFVFEVRDKQMTTFFGSVEWTSSDQLAFPASHTETPALILSRILRSCMDTFARRRDGH